MLEVSGGDLAALDAFAGANGLSIPTSTVPEPGSAGSASVPGGTGWLASVSEGRQFKPESDRHPTFLTA